MVPSGLIATATTGPSVPRKAAQLDPGGNIPEPHHRADRVRQGQESAVGEKDRATTVLDWPRIASRSRPFAGSQIRTVRSPPEEASVAPSGAKLSATTKSSCPASVDRIRPVATSQNVIRPSC